MSSQFELIYWPGFPGRGEHIRLLLEEAAVPYKDYGLDPDAAVAEVTELIGSNNFGDAFNPASFAPPFLKHGDIFLSQMPNILMYLANTLQLAPLNNLWHINQLAMTALDGLSNEAHDIHHPISVSLYYEDQKDEALLKAKYYREERLPKFLSYFERVLQGPKSGVGPWLYNGKITYADLVLFQVNLESL